MNRWMVTVDGEDRFFVTTSSKCPKHDDALKKAKLVGKNKTFHTTKEARAHGVYARRLP